MTDRKAFEEWVEKHPATMMHRPVEGVAWAAWQASRRAALTEAAAIVDRHGVANQIVFTGYISADLLRLRDKEGA